jgi:superfamily II DNA or RNA helicase
MIRQQLTVCPITNQKFGGTGSPFCVYFESKDRLYLPRHWARENIGPEDANALPEEQFLPSHITFQGKPFDYQEHIVQTFMDAGANGLICVPCGKGKTFMALYIAYKLKQRFLVVVDKEFFLQQWKSEMEAFFPGLRIGILQGSKLETNPEKYDCTICMLQTLCQKDFPSSTFRSYGFTIFDECHHLGAAHFSQALLKVQTRYMLGLSATPTRDDGLSKVFTWYLGNPVYWEKTREADETVQVQVLQYKTNDSAYNVEPVDYKGDVIMAKLLTQVVDCFDRTKKIVEIIEKYAKNDKSRRILVLSERKKHLETMESLLEKSGLKVGYYIGGMKADVREESGKESQVLLATYAMASEGMNIKTLNMVILASPRKKVEQSVGRILRQRVEERTCAPIIVDVVDSHGLYQGQYRKRRAFYKTCGYKIVNVGREDTTELESVEDVEPNEPEKPVSSCGFVDDD